MNQLFTLKRVFSTAVLAAVAVWSFGASAQSEAESSVMTPEQYRTFSQPDQTVEVPVSKSELFKKVAPSVVLVRTIRGKEVSIGAGSFVTADGYVLTNFHVVDRAERIVVNRYESFQKTENKEPQLYTAKLIAKNLDKDLALIKIDLPAGDLAQPVEVSSYQKLQVGEEVHAVGHPRGLFWTYTNGVISQIRKDIKMSAKAANGLIAAIQTQTPINPGNSGGPLFNGRGQMVGVNTFMASAGQEGLNFAVSGDDASHFISALLLKKPEQAEPPKPALTEKPKNIEEKHLAKLLRPCIRNSSKRLMNPANDTQLVELSSQCDGFYNVIYRIPNDTSLAIRMSFDTRRNGRPTMSILDVDRDGLWDYSLMDTNDDGIPDTVGIHADGGLLATKLQPYSSEKQLSSILSKNLKRQ